MHTFTIQKSRNKFLRQVVCLMKDQRSGGGCQMVTKTNKNFKIQTATQKYQSSHYLINTAERAIKNQMGLCPNVPPLPHINT